MIKKFLPQVVINYCWHLPKAILANIYYGFPSRGMTIVGITGTDGKTTTTNMLFQVLLQEGVKVAEISTINAYIAGEVYDTGFHVTSPDPWLVAKLLAKAKKGGDKVVVLEVTSHAIDQFRYWGIKFDISIITNITREHLDYHKTFENYFNTKAKLIKNARVSVLFKDQNFERLCAVAGGKVLSFGLDKTADLNPYNFPLKLKILGEFNVLNALAASLVARELKVSDSSIKKTLAKFENLAGRMQEIKVNKYRVFVDFAHTPNGLENALNALKSLRPKKLIAVFGAASQRDVGKRPIMGKIAAEIADIVILTSEDPRFEDPMSIIEQIKSGVNIGSKTKILAEADRTKAIKLAISLAKQGDVIGIFGKGHEQSMSIRGVERSYSDIDVVSKLI